MNPFHINIVTGNVTSIVITDNYTVIASFDPELGDTKTNAREILLACKFAQELLHLAKSDRQQFDQILMALMSMCSSFDGRNFVLEMHCDLSVGALLHAIKKLGMKRRAEFSAKRRTYVEAMLERGDRYICAECGRIGKLTVDHKIPLRWGGANDLDNMQFLCSECNSIKGTRLFESALHAALAAREGAA